MDNLSLILLLSIAAPICMMLFVASERVRRVLIFFISGLIICFVSGIINSRLIVILNVDKNFYSINFTPLIEEILKSLPILVYAFYEKKDKKKIFECAIAVGIGFAVLENAFILSSSVRSISIPLALVRGFGTGVMHGIGTLAVGFGMSFVHTRRKLFYTGTTALLGGAILYHSLFNILIQSSFQLIGFILPMLSFIPIVWAIKSVKGDGSD